LVFITPREEGRWHLKLVRNDHDVLAESSFHVTSTGKTKRKTSLNNKRSKSTTPPQDKKEKITSAIPHVIRFGASESEPKASGISTWDRKWETFCSKPPHAYKSCQKPKPAASPYKSLLPKIHKQPYDLSELGFNVLTRAHTSMDIPHSGSSSSAFDSAFGTVAVR